MLHYQSHIQTENRKRNFIKTFKKTLVVPSIIKKQIKTK